jgi:hypothetical protein
MASFDMVRQIASAAGAELPIREELVAFIVDVDGRLIAETSNGSIVRVSGADRLTAALVQYGAGSNFSVGIRYARRRAQDGTIVFMEVPR